MCIRDSSLAWSVPLAELPPGSSTTVRIPVPTSVRGVLTLHPVGVWCEDPFRLFASRAAMGPSAHMIVCPVPDMAEAARLPAHAVLTGRPADPRPGATPSASVAGDDLSSLRPYVPGDRLTRLHWPALARTGELVVRGKSSRLDRLPMPVEVGDAITCLLYTSRCV